MGVGRGTVREALKVLIYLGLIDRENRRTCISQLALERLTIKDIFKKLEKHRNVMEMIEVRKIIEPEATSLAADRANPYEIERIEEQYDADKFIDSDNKFHLYILQTTGNNLIKEIMQNIQQLMKKNQSLVLRKSRTIMPRSVNFHGKIFATIKD